VNANDIIVRTNVNTALFTGCSFQLNNNAQYNASTLGPALAAENVWEVTGRNRPSVTIKSIQSASMSTNEAIHNMTGIAYSQIKIAAFLF
jgi:hypothetical protein